MENILEKIADYKRREIELTKVSHPLEEVERRAREAPVVRQFEAALRAQTETGSFALICEIKKASPSKGLIRTDFDPATLARAYQAGGASCLSVLTDSPSFQGSAENLIAARQASTLPLLRKDFMFDPYQVSEARSFGADCILVILAAVSDEAAQELTQAAKKWGMDVLAEVHNECELSRALKLETKLIGINNRNLKTFETHLETTERLAPLVPDDRIIISESGISDPQDLARLSGSGVRTFLIGESLMRQDDVQAATHHLLSKGLSL